MTLVIARALLAGETVLDTMSKDVPGHYQRFTKEYPDLANAYQALGSIAVDSGPLDLMCVELVKIGASAGARMESAVKSHARRALEAGASPEQVKHAVLVTVTTLGFPGMMTALRWVQDVLEPGP